MSVRDIIEKIKGIPDCLVLPPSGTPNIEDHLVLPEDVLEFYQLCGGIHLFQHAAYRVNIVQPQDFVLANPVIVGERCEEDISANWYIVATDGNGDYLTVDLELSRMGKCYDSFWDSHGVVGECRVIAFSFLELIERLIQNKGEYWYWLEENFVSLGDAYDN